MPPPPSKKLMSVGRYVGRSVDQMVSKTISHRAFICNMLIRLGENKTSIDFRFTRSKVKATMVTFVKKWFPLIILTIKYHRAFIFHMIMMRLLIIESLDLGQGHKCYLLKYEHDFH